MNSKCISTRLTIHSVESPALLPEVGASGNGPAEIRANEINCEMGLSLHLQQKRCFFLQMKVRACLISTGAPKISITSNVWTHTWSIKYRLITKLNTQLTTNLRDESFKPN